VRQIHRKRRELTATAHPAPWLRRKKIRKDDQNGTAD
jgi:hypothetical protein